MVLCPFPTCLFPTHQFNSDAPTLDSSWLSWMLSFKRAIIGIWSVSSIWVIVGHAFATAKPTKPVPLPMSKIVLPAKNVCDNVCFQSIYLIITYAASHVLPPHPPLISCQRSISTLSRRSLVTYRPRGFAPCWSSSLLPCRSWSESYPCSIKVGLLSSSLACKIVDAMLLNNRKRDREKRRKWMGEMKKLNSYHQFRSSPSFFSDKNQSQDMNRGFNCPLEKKP